MGDLISRCELLKCFCENKEGERIPEYDCDNFPVTLSIKEIKSIIRNQPVAYDIEAVVKELEEQAKQYHRREKNCEGKNITVKLSEKFYGKACSYEHAIEIVKRGGIQ